MEIKTLEHYAISRIQELENELEKLNAMYKLQSKISDELREKLDFIRSLLNIKKAHDYTPENNRMIIEFSLWSTYDRAKFEQLCEIFGLSLPDELEEEEE